jgi:hypothetical protein
VIRKVYAVKDITAHQDQVLDDLRGLGAVRSSGPRLP